MSRKLILSVFLFGVLSAPALAQDSPFDVSFGYAVSHTSGMTGNGWWAAGEKGLTRNVGIVVDGSGHYAGQSVSIVGSTASANVASYGVRIGPRLWIPLENDSRMKPFVDVMIGGYHSSVDASVSGPGLPPIAVSGSDNGAAFGVGGGLDYRVGESMSVRMKPEWGSGLTGFALYTGLVMHLGR